MNSGGLTYAEQLVYSPFYNRSSGRVSVFCLYNVNGTRHTGYGTARNVFSFAFFSFISD